VRLLFLLLPFLFSVFYFLCHFFFFLHFAVAAVDSRYLLLLLKLLCILSPGVPPFPLDLPRVVLVFLLLLVTHLKLLHHINKKLAKRNKKHKMKQPKRPEEDVKKDKGFVGRGLEGVGKGLE